MKTFNLSDWALAHRSLVWYFMIAFMAAGLFAYLQLGRQEDPDFTIKTMVIGAQWPGASPEEMTRQVTDRIEKKLEGAGVARLHQERHRCGPNNGIRLSARHDEGCRRRADLGTRPQHDCGHQG
jgi:Cu/Ag efflux pump CusA